MVNYPDMLAGLVGRKRKRERFRAEQFVRSTRTQEIGRLMDVVWHHGWLEPVYWVRFENKGTVPRFEEELEEVWTSPQHNSNRRP
jgi:hypothetical protein